MKNVVPIEKSCKDWIEREEELEVIINENVKPITASADGVTQQCTAGCTPHIRNLCNYTFKYWTFNVQLRAAYLQTLHKYAFKFCTFPGVTPLIVSAMSYHKQYKVHKVTKLKAWMLPYPTFKWNEQMKEIHVTVLVFPIVAPFPVHWTVYKGQKK